LCQAGPEPEAWHALFCGAARILKMRILPPMAVGGVLLAAPGAGRRHWSPRPGPGGELILLEEPHPGRESHASAFPLGLLTLHLLRRQKLLQNHRHRNTHQPQVLSGCNWRRCHRLYQRRDRHPLRQSLPGDDDVLGQGTDLHYHASRPLELRRLPGLHRKTSERDHQRRQRQDDSGCSNTTPSTIPHLPPPQGVPQKTTRKDFIEPTQFVLARDRLAPFATSSARGASNSSFVLRDLEPCLP